MSDKKTITTIAFESDSDKPPASLAFKVLPFPQAWKRQFNELQREITSRRNGYVASPIKSLNTALRALAPDLVSINKGAAGDRAQHWLVAKRAIDTEALFLIIRAWIDAEFSGAAPASRERVIGRIAASDLSWADGSIAFAGSEISANGTAKPDSMAYTVLPNHLAWSVETSASAIKLGGQPLSLRRMALEPGASGAELLSWPPHEGQKGRSSGRFSYFFRFTVQTIPFRPEPSVYLHIGIRRWVTEETPIPSGTSMVIDTKVPWLKQLDAATSLAGSTVSCLPPSKGYRLEYRDRLSLILDKLQIDKLPDLNAMKVDPSGWIERRKGVSAAFVFSERLKHRHAVGTGVSADERRKLVEQIEPILSDKGLSLREPLESKFTKSVSVSNPFFAPASQQRKTESEEQFADRKRDERTARVTAITKELLELEVYYQSSSVLDALQTTLVECIGQPDEQGQRAWEWNLNGRRVALAWHELGRLGRLLELPKGRANAADQMTAAYSARCAEFTSLLSPAATPIGTIVELAGEDSFKSCPDKDPKDAIRVGLAATGRVSQFMTPTKEAELPTGPAHRAKSSWYDLFRQLGVLLAMPDLTGLGLPGHVRVIGLWLIKRTKHNSSTKRTGFLPVAVYWDSRDDILYALIHGVSKPLTYPEGLVAVGSGEGDWLSDEADAIHFVRSLFDDMRGGGDTLVLCDKHNFGGAWKWLNNYLVTRDAIAFGQEPSRPAADFPGIRVLRIRSEASNFETPEWYREKGNETKFAKGLWWYADRVYGSTYGKPTQAQKASQYTSKLAPWMNSKQEKTFDPRPQVNLPNPGFFEFTMACVQAGDDPAAWAALAHILRDAAVHFSDAIARPYPLLLAERIDEYAIPFERTVRVVSERRGAVKSAKR